MGLALLLHAGAAQVLPQTGLFMVLHGRERGSQGSDLSLWMYRELTVAGRRG